jgi:hypothetical protein
MNKAALEREMRSNLLIPCQKWTQKSTWENLVQNMGSNLAGTGGKTVHPSFGGTASTPQPSSGSLSDRRSLGGKKRAEVFSMRP